MSSGQEEVPVPVKRSFSKQVILALLANFSSIAPSMSLGFSAIAIPTLHNLNEEQISWFASIASLATPFGCFLSGPISDRFGRRRAIFSINVSCFIGWLVIGSAYHAGNGQYSLLLLGRILTGFSIGLASAPATTYMAEVASLKLRGVFTTWASVFFSLGILVVYILGGIFKNNWGTIALIAAVLPCIGMTFVIFLLPETPSWLVGKNRIEEAKRNTCKIFGAKSYTPEVQVEVEELIKRRTVKDTVIEKPVHQQVLRKVKFLLEPFCLKPIFLVMTFFFFQQFTGIFVIVFYAIDIVEKAGVTVDAYLTIVLIGLIRFLTSILLSCVSRKFGRRPLSIFSGIGMMISMLLLAVYVLMQEIGRMPESYEFLPLTLLLVYFLSSTLGFLPLPFAIAAEVFPTKVRGTASGLLCGFGYVFNFVAVKIYPGMTHLLGRHGVFFFYGGMSLLGTIFVMCFLPETKGKSLEQIQESLGVRQKKTKEELGLVQFSGY